MGRECGSVYPQMASQWWDCYSPMFPLLSPAGSARASSWPNHYLITSLTLSLCSTSTFFFVYCHPYYSALLNQRDRFFCVFLSCGFTQQIGLLVVIDLTVLVLKSLTDWGQSFIASAWVFFKKRKWTKAATDTSLFDNTAQCALIFSSATMHFNLKSKEKARQTYCEW